MRIVHHGLSIGVFPVSCIFRRFLYELTADCSELPRTGGVRGGLDGDLRF